MDDSGTLFTIPGYHISLLQEVDAGELQALLENCVDYCQLVDGHPPVSSAASSLITERPEGRAVTDKVVVGIYNREKKMVGVLDAIRDYPKQDAWWIGLLLIDPGYRNNGLGRMIVRSFEDWVSLWEAKGIFLGVIEENDKAFRFWQAVGFEVIERQAPRKFDNLSHVVITMIHDLTKVKSD